MSTTPVLTTTQQNETTSSFSHSTTTEMPTLPSTTTTTTNSVDLSKFESPFGYASLEISDRSELTEGFVSVTDELEFLDALLDPMTKVIEIENDLDLGFLEVTQKALAAGKDISSYSAVYKKHGNNPLLHPVLIETGVGRVYLKNRNGLMLYSQNGATIRHTSFEINESSDIVIRNLAFSELWEWDEVNEGGYKRNDWDYFTIEQSTGIWFDHLTFSRSYDGIIDVKDGCANMTLSWSRLVFETTDFIRAQIDWLEEHRDANPYYDGLRTMGATQTDITEFASFQKKGFNLGNTTDGTGFETITMTFHHLYVKNLEDRFPRIRKGDAHLYHVILDNTDISNLSLRFPVGIVNQGIVTTEQGAVLMENSIFIRVDEPIKNHQDSDPSESYSGKYRIINSELQMRTSTYFGSSENQGTYWVHAGSYAKLEFSFRNHSTIPYDYSLNDPYFLTETFALTPPGTVAWNDFNWLITNCIE